jgi:hypothetical protein
LVALESYTTGLFIVPLHGNYCAISRHSYFFVDRSLKWTRGRQEYTVRNSSTEPKRTQSAVKLSDPVNHLPWLCVCPVDSWRPFYRLDEHAARSARCEGCRDVLIQPKSPYLNQIQIKSPQADATPNSPSTPHPSK